MKNRDLHKYQHIGRVFMRLQIVILLLPVCPVIAFSQKRGEKGIVESKYECSWSMKFIDDTIKMIPGIEDRIILQIGDNLAYQYSYRDQQWDTLVNAIKSSEDWDKFVEDRRTELRNSNLRENGVLRHNALGTVKLYKDYKAKKIKVVDHISIHWFIYEEILLPQNWEIQDDTTTIAGYSCQKAVCDYRGRCYEAWFASEIPMSEGPWKFCGLPGLIIRLNDTQHHYEFDLIEFKKIDNMINTNVITTKKLVRANITYKLTEIERKNLLEMQWGKKGDLIMEADMAKIGLSHTPPVRNHDYIERDY